MRAVCDKSMLVHRSLDVLGVVGRRFVKRHSIRLCHPDLVLTLVAAVEASDLPAWLAAGATVVAAGVAGFSAYATTRDPHRRLRSALELKKKLPPFEQVLWEVYISEQVRAVTRRQSARTLFGVSLFLTVIEHNP